jgi:hypothetical protein
MARKITPGGPEPGPDAKPRRRPRADPRRVDEQVRAAMKARKITPYALTKRIGIEPSGVTRWYYRRRDLKLETFARMCLELGLVLCPAPEPDRQ